jgi:hypothetical protein
MLNGVSAQRLYASFKRGDSNYQGATGQAGFCRLLHESLGLTEDELGRTVVSDRLSDGTRRFRPEEFSFKELAEAMVGPEWVQKLDPRANKGTDPHGTPLLEAGTAVQPSAFADINAYSTAVGGLIQVKVLESYQKPAFIADQLVKTIPTKQRFEKLPGIARVGDKAEDMHPGQPHPRVQLGERYVTTPYTKKRGLGIDVTTEAVFFDLTNEVYARADSVGDELGLRKEKLVLDVVLGIANTYVYNGTGYTTYLTSGNWINKVTSNPLIDWTSIDVVLQLFADMTDQEAGEKIVPTPDTILTMPYKMMTSRMILKYTEVERRTQTAAEIGRGSNPLSGDLALKPLSSPIAYQRLTDSDGAALSASTARNYWVTLDSQRAFGYAENWSLDIKRVTAPEYVMADQGLVLSVFADEMGIPFVNEPRQTCLSTG